ncbi:uncharacterized protein LOC115630780 [Scaptodrosophila lebanonensis]|uniref:Uncharacterized protein LOC115630780 n=1 Tax=Drosophila lebanonensis TaxID=7225 RepID=A0A6J2U3T6_DROLE|nr:uncharacterized protein LOC115630780 [Scaptodrosophila lebanonensis]
MELAELRWLQKIVPLLYSALQNLEQLPSETRRIKRLCRRVLSPPPPPETSHKQPQRSARKRKIANRQPQNNRKIWVKKENQSRDADGLFATTFERIYQHNHDEFKNRTRMTPQVFDMLFCLVGEQLNKNSIRTPIAPECRLFLTLIYLANAESVLELSKAFKMGPSTVRAIVQETCDLLWNILAPAFLPQPNEQAYTNIAENYEQMWHVPHCLGAVDCKLVDLSYRGQKEIVLLASCDTNLAFTSIDIATVEANKLTWQQDFATQLFNHQLSDLMPAEPLDETDIANAAYTYIADASFPMRENLITSYTGGNLNRDQVQFNKLLSQALEGSIGKAFDVLFSRWSVLTKPLPMSPTNAVKIVKAVVVLHNFVQQHDEAYCPPDFVEKVPSCDLKSKVPSILLSHVTPLSRMNTIWQLRDRLKVWMNAKSDTLQSLINSVVWTD